AVRIFHDDSLDVLTSFVQPRIQSDRSIGLIEWYFFRAGQGPNDEMLVRNFLVPELRGNSLRRMQCLLHLLRKFIRPHVSRYCSLPGRQPDLSLVGNEARYFRQDEMRILMDQAAEDIEELSGREFQRAQT